MSYQKWTHEEELKLKLAVDKYGNDWDVICAEEFPQRRVVCLKNKYYCRIYNNPAFDQKCQGKKAAKDNQHVIDNDLIFSDLKAKVIQNSPSDQKEELNWSDRFFLMYIRDVILQ
ncbi:Conserved_hypothetical protein [Hexamita inflata]|uniref:Myb-like domain-containing protein n=1 Tax=Hexamita inflata TaxID=28002 RepID=A0AA86V0T8_9EUKA|nr:Conserved hypothetical protein [Hexamita inflata]